ncbi:ABC transporter substrate-binding protein [Rhizobium sp. C4]|uniref:ABC transporter substrate-binding protein n=1 Tax=Rhizobium sp. C4 TaxID=1349800 RepID=UPI001E349D02|nr:ABC transporter substrate-binding protein [Rhizobium sp. C4]MCD2172312.1 ABC transporter substrate-binding protein [Rhizobium sp. C4]
MNIFLKVAIGACAALATQAAYANDKITIAYTPNAESAPIYVGAEQGIFAKHGLDAELVAVPLNSALPAAIMSGSVTIATFTPTTFIQASNNGIELRAIAGMTVTSHKATRVGLVAAKGGKITKVEDLKGKKIGVPGIGAVLDIMARRVLIDKGVDPATISYTETTFPTQGDLLKGGTVDAVVSVDPFIGRMEGTGVGVLIGDLLEGVDDGQTAQFFGVSKEWADKNPNAIKEFRAAIAEANEFVKKDEAKTREAIGKYLKLPAPVLTTIALPATDASITAKQLDWWAGVMKKQGIISGDIDTKQLIAK